MHRWPNKRNSKLKLIISKSFKMNICKHFCTHVLIIGLIFSTLVALQEVVIAFTSSVPNLANWTNLTCVVLNYIHSESKHKPLLPTPSSSFYDQSAPRNHPKHPTICTHPKGKEIPYLPKLFLLCKTKYGYSLCLFFNIYCLYLQFTH